MSLPKLGWKGSPSLGELECMLLFPQSWGGSDGRVPSGREREYPVAYKGGTVEVTAVNPEACYVWWRGAMTGWEPQSWHSGPHTCVLAFLTPKQLGSSRLLTKALI